MDGDGEGSRHLAVCAGGASFLIPEARVLGVAEAGPVAPIPFTDGAVAGLVEAAGRPVVRLDVARLLGLGGAGRPTEPRLVLVSTGTGAVALAVGSVGRMEAGRQDAPLLLPERLVPWLTPPMADAAGWSSGDGVAVTDSAAVTVLLVEAAGGRVACLLDGLARVAEVEELMPLPVDTGPTPGGGVSHLVRVDGALRPARRLAGGTGPGWALLPEAADSPALLVDRVVGLQTLPASRLVEAGGRWFADPGPGRGPPLAVRHVGEWVSGMGTDRESGTLASAPTLPLRGSLPPPRAGEGRGEGGLVSGLTGLRCRCGELEVGLPLDLAGRVWSVEDVGPMGPAGGGRWPVLDGGRLFGVGDGHWRHLVEIFAGRGRRPLALAVARALPDTAAPADWLPLPPVPPAAAALFDAVHRDAGGGWVWRLRTIPPANRQPLPPSVRRAVRRSRLGWWHPAR